MKTRLICVAVAVAMTAGVGRAEEGARITLRVVNSAVAAGALAKAEKEASGVLQRAGLETTWRDCTAPVVCPGEPAANEFWFHIANWRPAASPAFEMGFTVLDGGKASNLAGVYYPAVRKLVEQSCTSEADALAAVMVHEVGHLLGAEHSKRGVMRPQFGRQDIVEMGQGGLGFSVREAARLRAEIVRRLPD